MLKSFLSKRQENHQNEEGFTLLELMIVVVIIGVLAAIALPVFANQQKAAIDAQTLSDLKSANVALTTWKAQHPTADKFNNVEINAAYERSMGSIVQIYGTPMDYCIKVYNSNGAKYRSNLAPYAIFISATGQTGNANVLGHASTKSCNVDNTVMYLV